jgi:hypothetical protein
MIHAESSSEVVGESFVTVSARVKVCRRQLSNAEIISIVFSFVRSPCQLKFFVAKVPKDFEVCGVFDLFGHLFREQFQFDDGKSHQVKRF